MQALLGDNNPWRFFNPRLCEKDMGMKSAQRIFGNRYEWTCTEATLDPRAGKISNGWECISVDPTRLEIVNRSPVSPAGFHPECANYSQGFDTGYQPVVLRYKNSWKTFYAVNTHLTGTLNTECRIHQIRDLGRQLRSWGTPDVIIAGDFNTEPFSAADGAAATFQQQFGLASAPQPPVANLISDGKSVTAFYIDGAVKQALDHVLGKNFGGHCTIAGEFSGMDHRMMTCNLNHTF